MARILLASVGVLMLLGACSSEPAVPDFALLGTDSGFVELASGEGSDKEPRHFWLFGGERSFNDWRSEAVATFTGLGWRVFPEGNMEGARDKLLASAPDERICINYLDMNSSDPFAQHARQSLTILALEALEHSTEYASVIYVAAGRCA